MNYTIIRKNFILVFFVFFLLSGCGKKPVLIKKYISSGKDNKKEYISKPTLILISLDGFRYDYLKKFSAPVLERIKNSASSADALIPVFPSKTFPNHISLITGRNPVNSGILSNQFYNPDTKKTYIYFNSRISNRSYWYKGDSLWSVCMQNGLRSASVYWPGSEVKIGKYRPGFYLPYEKNVSDKIRINTLIHLLKLKENRRPHFLTLYFPQPDLAGHHYGPNSAEMGEVIKGLDNAIAYLLRRLKEEKIKTNIVITSDHGMQQVYKNKVIVLSKYIDTKKFIFAGHGSHIFLYVKKKINKNKLITDTIQKLKKNKHLKVYRRQKSPPRWKLRKTKLAGDIIVVSRSPYFINVKKRTLRHKGYHGWDPAIEKNMHGIFIALGPDIKSGIRLPSFPNIDVYPFVLEVLGLPVPENIDADKDTLKILLKKPL